MGRRGRGELSVEHQPQAPVRSTRLSRGSAALPAGLSPLAASSGTERWPHKDMAVGAHAQSHGCLWRLSTGLD